MTMRFYTKRVLEFIDEHRYIPLSLLMKISLSEFGLSPLKLKEIIEGLALTEKITWRDGNWICKRVLIKQNGEIFPWEKDIQKEEPDENLDAILEAEVKNEEEKS